MIDGRKLFRYSRQLHMAKELLDKKLITEEEYKLIVRILKKDYGIVSDMITHVSLDGQ